LVNDLKAKFGTDKLTVRTGIHATIDFRKTLLNTVDKEYAISSVGTAGQELVLVGGLEKWVKKKLA